MEKRWIDKNAILMVSIIGVVILGMLIAVWMKFAPKGNFLGPIICTGIVILFFLTSSHHLPLTVSRGSIFLASPSFPSIGRKGIKLSEIKEIFIDNCREWDEKARAGYTVFVVRVTDVAGKRYRNIIFRQSVKAFRNAIQEQGYAGIIKGH